MEEKLDQVSHSTAILDSTTEWSHFGDSVSQLQNIKLQYIRKIVKNQCRSSTMLAYENHINFLVAHYTTALPLPLLPFPQRDTELSSRQKVQRKAIFG